MPSSADCTTADLRRNVNCASVICVAPYSRPNTPMLKEWWLGLNTRCELSATLDLEPLIYVDPRTAKPDQMQKALDRA